MMLLFALVFVGSTSVLMGQASAKQPRDAEGLRAFYAQHCVRCHGVDGAAQGPEGKRLKGADFTDSQKMAKKKDPELARAIQKGIFFGIAMPAYKEHLNLEESRLLVSEVLRRAEKGKPIVPGTSAK